MFSFRLTKMREWPEMTISHWRPAKDAPLTEAAGSGVFLTAGVRSPSIADPPELLMNEPPLGSVMMMRQGQQAVESTLVRTPA
jgi:hypothetical protein